MTTLLRYRECRKGESIDIGECTECLYGTFSLGSQVTRTVECIPCTDVEGVKECRGSRIELKDGYWRRSENHAKVLTCQYMNGCSENRTSTSSASCEEGYEGPLCAGCSSGYYNNGDVCATCSGSGDISTKRIVFLVVAVVLVVMLVAFIIYRLFKARYGKKALKTVDKKDSG